MLFSCITAVGINTQLPVYWVHLAKINAVQYNSPAINPLFVKAIMFRLCWIFCHNFLNLIIVSSIFFFNQWELIKYQKHVSRVSVKLWICFRASCQMFVTIVHQTVMNWWIGNLQSQLPQFNLAVELGGLLSINRTITEEKMGQKTVQKMKSFVLHQTF